MFWVIILLITVVLVNSDESNITLIDTRRIIRGRETGETRRYMVYLRPANSADKKLANSNWLCGGVIIHEKYILTSAACIEDVKNFYVVSGTHRWTPASDKNNECVKNGAKRAVWKCVPKSYYYDGDEFDNIKWMVGDIAVVRVEDNFNFEKRVKGCDFIPTKINFNNGTEELEKPGTVGTITGWGTTSKYSDVILSHPAANSPELLEADVRVITKERCRARWSERYHFIIEKAICSQGEYDDENMSKTCLENYVDCKALEHSGETRKDGRRQMILNPDKLVVHTAQHFFDTRRQSNSFGGFCENDHGGPLVVGQGKTATVIGVMSACQTKNITFKCFGPFFFTSVYKYRHLISCAIDKDVAPECKRMLRSSRPEIAETTFQWEGLESFITTTPKPPSTKWKHKHHEHHREKSSAELTTRHEKKVHSHKKKS